MAKDKQTIYNELLAEKQSRPELAGLNTPSNTGIWQYWLQVFATFFYLMEVKWDLFKNEVQEVIDTNQFGTFEWWNKKVLEFQYGDQLMFINNRFTYATPDTGKRIVHYCSISDERGLVKIKAAKIGNDRPVPLNVQEVAGLLSYVREIRPPGTRISVESLPADKLKTTLKIHYNAQLGEAAIRAAVEAAYLNYINNIVFDGLYFVNKMIDVLQAIPGVVEEQVEVIEIAVRQGTDPYVQFTSKYQAKSGYFQVDTSYPLSATFIYVGV